MDAFSGAHWGSLSNEPTLVGQGGKPLVIFDGIRGTTGDYARGCIYGAAGTTQPYTLEPWSLSNDCVNPVGSAAEDKTGALAAAWGGASAVRYRLGTSPTIPATGSDNSIPLGSGDVYKTGTVADAGGSDDFYVAWAQEFSNPAAHDGYYVKDVTAGGATMKAPGSDTDSINRLGGFTNLAIAARSGHAGVYVGYCTGSAKCSLKLLAGWRGQGDDCSGFTEPAEHQHRLCAGRTDLGWLVRRHQQQGVHHAHEHEGVEVRRRCAATPRRASSMACWGCRADRRACWTSRCSA